MAREFNRNMFIMLFAVMIGVILITYFVADIARRSEIEALTGEIETITTEKETFEARSINFTDYFMKSSCIILINTYSNKTIITLTQG